MQQTQTDRQTVIVVSMCDAASSEVTNLTVPYRDSSSITVMWSSPGGSVTMFSLNVTKIITEQCEHLVHIFCPLVTHIYLSLSSIENVLANLYQQLWQILTDIDYIVHHVNQKFPVHITVLKLFIVCKHTTL